jgi:hypothetical protein
MFVLSCVQVAALRRADPPSKESYRLYIDQETEKAAKSQQRAVESWMDGWMDGWILKAKKMPLIPDYSSS